MEYIRPRTLFILCLVALAHHPLFAQDVSLHKFVTETARFYDNQLVTDGTHLYGVRYDGHIEGKGAIFRMDMTGANFELLHSFDDPGNGYNPVGTLALSGTSLYGMTVFGGASDVGVIFKIETDGTGFQKLLDFNSTNGALPYASLIVSGSVLFGIAQQGGVGMGVVFRVNTDGSAYQKLLDFDGSNGQTPVGSLAISGDTLFGVTNRGGASDLGVVYRIQTNGEGHEVIFNFDENTGFNPFGGVTVSGTTLYGTTGQGQFSLASGSPFRINTDGTGFEQLEGLTASNPNGQLALIDSTLYGMTSAGGQGSGVIYSFKLRDQTYATLHEFNIVDGRNPSGSLLAFGGRLYGYVPGGVHGYGVIFSMDPDGNNFTVMKDFDATNTGFDPHGGLIFTVTRAYGVTSFGGTHNQGVIYSINQDGTGYEVIHNFEREEGAQPDRSLVMTDSALYGVTLLGGTDESGVLFRVDTTGANYEVLHHFSGAQGSFPSGSLVSGTEELLYGTTSAGGLDNKGTVFQFNKDTKEIKTLIDFSTVNAQNPTGTMVLADTILYGLALGGVGDGVLFSVKTDGTGFVKVVDKDSESSGRYGNSLALKDSVIYVSMRQGGTDDVGVLFSVKTNGENFKKLFDFSYGSGAVPEGAIIVTDTLLYGMTQMGGPDGAGVAYSIHPDGTGYTPLFTFDDSAGSSSGRMMSTNGVQNTSGSVSLFNDALYATVTSTTDRTTIGTIRRYEFDTGGDEDGGGEEDAVTDITPDGEDVISVFPNPTANFVTVESPTKTHLLLMDVSGRPLVIVRSGERTIDLTRLSAGIYFLVVDGKTFRIVKN